MNREQNAEKGAGSRYTRIAPALRPLWRGDRTVQLGVDPEHAVVLEFADHRAARLLSLLDGTRSTDQVCADAHDLGIPDRDANHVLAALSSAQVLCDSGSLLPAQLTPATSLRLTPEAAALSLREQPRGATPAEVMRRRRDARILVTGRGRLVAPIAALLAQSGVGAVYPALDGTATEGDAAPHGLLPTDRGRPRQLAAVDAIHRCAADTDTTTIRQPDADLAVIVGTPRPVVLEALANARHNVVHLAVWLRDGAVIVGPLVRPGMSACLQCVDQHRRDRDPDWPLLAVQLATGRTTPEPCESAVAALGAAITVREVLEHLDGGDPESLGGTVEVTRTGRIRRRSWTPHPACGCLPTHADQTG